jgi:hypothetical protein
MGHRRDGRKVRHLEGLRPRRLDQHRAGVRLEQFFDLCAGQRVEIAGLYAIAGQEAVAEIAGRPVDAVGNKDVIAGACGRQ